MWGIGLGLSVVGGLLTIWGAGQARNREHGAPKELDLVRFTSFQSARDSSSQCDAVLLPQLEISNSTVHQKVAWLSIITRENYAQAESGGGIRLILFDLPIDVEKRCPRS